MTPTIPDVVQETIELYSTGKKVMAKIAYNLLFLETEGGWKQNYDKFPQFVEQVIGIGQSQTSKLLTIARFFSDKYQADQLGTADYELLYASARLGGAPELALSRAQTWSRDDFRKEKDEVQPHTPDFKKVCVVAGCWRDEEHHP